MLKKTILLCLLFSSTNGFTKEENNLFKEHDKKLHMASEAAITLGSSFLFKDTEHPVLYPILTGVTFGIAKELHDKIRGHSRDFSGRDLEADAIGMGVGLAIYNGFSVVIDPKGKSFFLGFNKNI